MLKFENINILETLEKIMRTNTKIYQSDFEADKEILLKIAQEAKELSPQNKTYLWMSRPYGTWCFKERNTFLKETIEYNTWIFYGEQTNDKILAYTVEIKTMKNKTVIGNLYQINYQEHFKHVKKVCIPSDTIAIYYENGKSIKEKKDITYFHPHDHILFGKFLSYEDLPNNPSDLENLLNTERKIREKFLSGNIEQHINKLIYQAESLPNSYV